MGLKGVDLLEAAEFDIPRRYGLICTMGMPVAGRFRMRWTVPSIMAPLKRHSARTSDSCKGGRAERHHLFWDPPWHVG
jgi:hypothetical protein